MDVGRGVVAHLWAILGVVGYEDLGTYERAVS
jgi:hypothetical protein